MRNRELLVSKLVSGVNNCVRFYGHFEEDGVEYYIYENCKGGDLTELKMKQPEKRFTEVVSKPMLHQIAQSIREMHNRRIVHRDIKLENIMLTEASPNATCKTADFGSARKVNENSEFEPEQNETLNQSVAGSGFYMSPEMKSEKPNGTKTDVWSFGILIGVMFGLDDLCPAGYIGGVPGFVKDVCSNKHDLLLAHVGIFMSPIVKDLITNMLCVDPSSRYTMQQVLDHRYFAMDQDKYQQGY